jgi:molybdopterin-binding protein
MGSIRALNHIKATIQEIQRGEVLTHVVARLGNEVIEALITRTSADAMQLKVGDTITVTIKATDVMLARH